ncbi:MFS transporter [Propionivibrio sp.]|uniref:MFS transporter n=1 Tax=Propionivibrio sp. TaxID=2212460 RepID=UPI00272EB9C0|nr:MFS transporter [Propionivibrio sp.]
MKSGIRLNATLLRLIGVQICMNGCMAGIRMAAPLLALRAGYSAATVGILLALFAFVQLFLAIPAGRYADRNTLKRPVGFCTIAAVLGAVLVAAWPIFPVLCVAALLTGGATGAAVITLQRHAGRLADDPTQIKQVFSWLAIAPSIANFVGPFVAGLVIDHAGFRASFLGMGVLAACSWVLVRSSGDTPLRQCAPEAQETSRSWDLLAEPRMRLLLLINWILSSCWDVHTFVLPILGHERGLSASVIGAILGTFAVAATVVRLVMPMIASRLQEWAVIAGAMLSAAVLYAVYPLLHSPWAMFLCSVLLGLSLGSVQPMVMSTLHQITPPHRQGEALGLRLMSINVSSILMPMVFGTVGTAIGVASVFWAVSAGVLGCTRAAWKLKSWSRVE